MGTCFSKKNEDKENPSPAATAAKDPPRSSKPLPHQPNGPTPAPPQAQGTPKAQEKNRRQIFVAVPGKNEKKTQPKEAAAAAAPVKILPTTSSEKKPAAVIVPPKNEDTATNSLVRTSSCTKEEVESILIQCGRLSRNSSAVEDEFRRSRKRSFDFDSVDSGPAGEDKDKPHLNRASPRRHRRTPSRDRDGEFSERKRSVSRERGSGGGRRVSRSPARRSESPAPSAGSQQTSSALEKTRQNPARLVSVPPREKPGHPLSEVAIKKAPPPVFSAAADRLRSSSPRARSPATSRPSHENAHSLSRSSSRKESPHRRNPMAEVDSNVVLRAEPPAPLKSNQTTSDDKIKTSRKPEERTRKAAPPIQTQKIGGEIASATQRVNAIVEVTNVISPSGGSSSAGSRCSKAKDEQEETGVKTGIIKGEVIPAAPASSTQPGTRIVSSRRSSRRSSRDLDAKNKEDLLLNNSSSNYASLLLEDIHNYHQQAISAAAPPPVSTVPACVAKANLILEALADFNKAKPGKSEMTAADEAAKKAKVVVAGARDFRAELEPQESAGSNSVVGQPTWTASSSPSEPTCSVDSGDGSWTSTRINASLETQQRDQKRNRGNGISKAIVVNVV